MKQVIIPNLIIEKQSKTGKPYATIELADGRKINTFDMKLSDELHRGWLGKSINAEIEQNGDFYQLVGFEPVTSSGAVSSVVLEPSRAYNNSPRDSSIIAQTLTKCFYDGNVAKTTQEVLETYNFYLKNL